MALNKSRCARFAPLQACALATITAYAQSSEATVKFDLPPQSLEQALKDFSVSADKQLLFATDLAEGKMVAGLSGEMEPMEALDELLDGTGLIYETTLSNVILVKIADVDEPDDRDSENLKPKPVLMAQNRTRAPRSEQSLTDSSGNDSDEGDEGIIPLEEIIVTGTNIRGVENPTVPVLRFDREDIDLSGAATVDDFLRTIPQNFSSETQLTAESGNPFTSGRNDTQGTSVDLRGLGAGSTLTLLNGRRMAAAGTTSNVDINVLPLALIERIDVVTDGATAVYGSDAVGGVVNFLTRKDYEGFEINGSYGSVTDGSMENWSVGAAGGFNWSSGGVYGGVDYQDRTPLLIEERPFVDLLLTPEPGAAFGSESQSSTAAIGLNQELSERTVISFDFLYSDIENSSPDLSSLAQTIVSEQTALYLNSKIEHRLTDNTTGSLYFDLGQNRVENSRNRSTTGDASGDEFENDQIVLEGTLSGTLATIAGGDVSFSFGGLYRDERFENFNQTIGQTLTEGDREVHAVYAELLVPLVGEENALPFVKELDLSIAGRYEDYSDLGDSLDPKIGLYWKPTTGLGVRASHSESFRAPDLTSLNRDQIFVASVFPTFLFTAIAPEEVIFTDPFPAYIYLQPSGGNPDLEPERAETLSLGFTYEPPSLKGLSIQANYFDIDYKNRLESVSFTLPIQDENFTQLVAIPPNLETVESVFARGAAGEIDFFNPFNFAPEDIQILYAPSFVNIAQREVSGLDLNVNYTSETDMGRLSAGLNASYLLDYIGRLSESSEASEQLSTLYRPVDLKLRTNFSWSKDGLTAFAAINYVDDYRDDINEEIANKIDSWTTVDFSIFYDSSESSNSLGFAGTRVGVSVMNIFDEDPPFVMTPFGLNYDSANANPFGRQISLIVSQAF